MPKKEEIGTPEEKPDVDPKQPVEKQDGQENPLAAIESMLTKIYEAIMSKQDEPEKEPQTPEEEVEEKGEHNGDVNEDPEPDEKVEGYMSGGVFHPIRDDPDYSESRAGEGRGRRMGSARGASSMDTLVAKAVKAELQKLGIKETKTPGQKTKGEKGIAEHPAEQGAKGVITGVELANMTDAELMTKIEGGEFA